MTSRQITAGPLLLISAVLIVLVLAVAQVFRRVDQSQIPPVHRESTTAPTQPQPQTALPQEGAPASPLITPPAEVFVERSDSTCRQLWKNGERDFTCIAFKPRARVVRIIGSPTPPALLQDPLPPDCDGYPWGFVSYEKGLLRAFSYNYSLVPADYPWGPQALEWIGLKKTSEPHDYGFVVGWDKDSGQLVCCGLIIETVGMLKSVAQINVRFGEKVAPK